MDTHKSHADDFFEEKTCCKCNFIVYGTSPYLALSYRASKTPAKRRHAEARELIAPPKKRSFRIGITFIFLLQVTVDNFFGLDRATVPCWKAARWSFLARLGTESGPSNGSKTDLLMSYSRVSTINWNMNCIDATVLFSTSSSGDLRHRFTRESIFFNENIEMYI